MGTLDRIIQEGGETGDAEGREKGQWGCEVLKARREVGSSAYTGGGLTLGRSRETPSKESGAHR